MIIDAHVHLPVEDGCDSLKQKKERLLREMSANQVDRCIVISDSTMESTIGTLDECVNLFADTDNVHVVGGISPFHEFDKQLHKLKTYIENRRIVGIKLYPGHEEFYLSDKRLHEVYELVCAYDVPVLFHSGWDNSQYADMTLTQQVAKAYPQLRLVCCHCFYPQAENCLPLLKLGNVFFDISSVADDIANTPDVAVYIRKLIEAAGDKVMFGSEYSCCEQSAHIEFVKALKLTADIEEKVFHKNAEKIYRI